MTALRIGICLLIAFCVLAFGTVEAWSVSVMEIGAAALLLWWALITWRDSRAKVYWSLLQASVLGLIAIGTAQLLFHGSAYPYLTRTMLLKLSAYFIVLFLATQAFRERKDLQKLAWFVMVFGFAVSLFAIVQHFTSTSEIYWMSDVKVLGDAYGPYVNRNHFAGFVELTVPTGLALLAFQGLKRDLFPLATLLTVVPISAIVLSASRGGILGFGLEIVVLVLLARSRKGWGWKRGAVAAIMSLVAVGVVAWIGTNGMVQRLSGTSLQEVTLGRRGSMFRGAAHIFRDNPIKGCGLGTLVAVFPAYETAYDGKVVDHVHDDYIEGLAETGILGGLCGLVFLGTLFREGRKKFAADQGRFSRGLHAGAIMAVSGLLLHSFVDFNLQIPANALLFLLQAYLVTAPPLASEAPAARHRRQATNSTAVMAGT
jgi:O-antigen ligase